MTDFYKIPCPCGAEAEVVEEPVFGDMWVVKCDACKKSTVWAGGPNEAKEDWENGMRFSFGGRR